MSSDDTVLIKKNPDGTFDVLHQISEGPFKEVSGGVADLEEAIRIGQSVNPEYGLHFELNDYKVSYREKARIMAIGPRTVIFQIHKGKIEETQTEFNLSNANELDDCFAEFRSTNDWGRWYLVDGN